jgi:hypothetical protein
MTTSALAETAGIDVVPPRSWRDGARSRFGAILDRIAMRGMGLAFDRTLMPDAAELASIRASAAPYLTRELHDDAYRFFACLDDEPDVDAREVGRRPIAGGASVRLELQAPYTPFCADPAAPPCPANERVPIEHWVHDAPAPATVLALHGFTMGDPARDAEMLMAPEWFALGCDVVLMTLPFHGTRTPPTARYSGELFASWHVGRLNEAVRQSIVDVQRVRAWLRTRDATPVGIVGLSLGGYLASLAAELIPDWAFAIPIAAPVRLGSFPSALFARSVYARRGPAPFAPAELDEAYAVHSPLGHALAIPTERALIVAGRGDAIVQPEQPLALWRHWGRPSLHWYDGSHVTPFRRRTVFAAGVRHLRSLGLVA